MKIVVTGSEGFVGKKIVALLGQSHEIIGINKVNKSANEYCTLCCDISNKIDIKNALKEIKSCDVVVHCAAKISFNNYDQSILDVNCIGTLNVFKLAVQCLAKQIIFISSIQVLQPPQDGMVDETSKSFNNTTLYHISKAFGESLLGLPEFSAVKTAILRITAPVSPEMPPNRMFPLFLKKASIGEAITVHGRGQRVQNYVDIRDIANAVNLAIENHAEGIFHISGESYSNLDIAKACFNLCNKFPQICFSGQSDPEENSRWFISNEKSKRQLQYTPHYRVKDVLAEMKEKINYEPVCFL